MRSRKQRWSFLLKGLHGTSLTAASVSAVSMLTPDTDPVQLDILGDELSRLRLERMERSIDGLRHRYGHQIMQRGILLTHQRFADINPKEDHTIHPVPFFAG